MPARAISTSLLASLEPGRWHPDARREVLVNYLGFPFWDVLTFPMTSAREIGELNEILIDRISPQDARALKGFEGIESLKGVRLRALRRVSVARLPRERLPARPPACARPADRHRLQLGRARSGARCDRCAGIEAAGLQPDSRCRGKAPRPQPRADLGAAAQCWGDEADASRRTPATARRRPKSSPPPPTAEYPPRWSAANCSGRSQSGSTP